MEIEYEYKGVRAKEYPSGVIVVGNRDGTVAAVTTDIPKAVGKFVAAVKESA